MREPRQAERGAYRIDTPARRRVDAAPRRCARWAPGPLLLAAALLAGGAGCRQDMMDQARYESLEASTFFGDGLSARPLVEGTIPRGHLQLDDHFYTGKKDGDYAETFPLELTEAFLERGRTRYEIYCTPCHDRVGTGNGMVVQRGFRRPASFHDERLRESPPGYFFEVMTRGFGAMPDYAHQIKPRDRWAIAAYIRALQLSQRAEVRLLSKADRKQLEVPTKNEQPAESH